MKQVAELLDDNGECTGEFVPCRAYCPWKHDIVTHDQKPLPPCSACRWFGKCEWSFAWDRLVIQRAA